MVQDSNFLMCLDPFTFRQTVVVVGSLTLLADIAAGQSGVRVVTAGAWTGRLLLLLRRVRDRRLGGGGSVGTGIALVDLWIGGEESERSEELLFSNRTKD